MHLLESYPSCDVGNVGKNTINVCSNECSISVVTKAMLVIFKVVDSSKKNIRTHEVTCSTVLNKNIKIITSCYAIGSSLGFDWVLV